MSSLAVGCIVEVPRYTSTSLESAVISRRAVHVPMVHSSTPPGGVLECTIGTWTARREITALSSEVLVYRGTSTMHPTASDDMDYCGPDDNAGGRVACGRMPRPTLGVFRAGGSADLFTRVGAEVPQPTGFSMDGWEGRRSFDAGKALAERETSEIRYRKEYREGAARIAAALVEELGVIVPKEGATGLYDVVLLVGKQSAPPAVPASAGATGATAPPDAAK